MRVKFKRPWFKTYPKLTPGNTYRVLEVSGGYVRVMDDIGEPLLFLNQAFDVVDNTTPPDWIVGTDEDGQPEAAPAIFQDGFFERWFDRDSETRATLSFYLSKLCWNEAELAEPQSSCLRVVTRDKIIYSEIDDDGWEMRKLVSFRNGRFAFADGTESFGADLSRVHLDEHHERISSEEFERLWSEAYSQRVDSDKR